MRPGGGSYRLRRVELRKVWMVVVGMKESFVSLRLGRDGLAPESILVYFFRQVEEKGRTEVSSRAGSPNVARQVISSL